MTVSKSSFVYNKYGLIITYLMVLQWILIISITSLRQVDGLTPPKQQRQDSSEEEEIDVIPNPFQNQTTCATMVDFFVESQYLLTKPLVTQKDTFQDLGYAKIMNVPVPVYRMKQPERIAKAQLEFELILVQELSEYGLSSIREVPVNFEQAKDSWFPGYFWSPLVMDCPGEKVVQVEGEISHESASQHVGWKFEAWGYKREDPSAVPHFYALMVRTETKKKLLEERVYLAGFKAPGWMSKQSQQQQQQLIKVANSTNAI